MISQLLSLCVQVLLFDGVCAMCNATVDFILRSEHDHELRFAALQSDAAATLLAERLDQASVRALREGQSGDPDTLVLLDDDRVLVRSTAVLAVAAHLRWPWRAAWVGWLMPRVLRDALYRFVAARRYAWFGKKEACRIPTPEQRARFLE